MKRFLSMILMVSLVVGLLAGCGSNSSSSASSAVTGSSTEASTEPSATGTSTETELVPLTLSFSTWVGSGPFFIALKNGYYKKYGLDVQIKIVEDEAQYAALVGSNAIQALGHVVDREVISYSKGIEETLVMAYDQSTGGDGIVASAEVKTAKDLVGHTVALNKSSTSYFYFLTMLEKNGINEKDITIKDMDADSAGTAFVQGKVDAAVSWEPWLTNASQRKGGHLLYSSKDFPNTIVDAVTIRNDFCQKYPDKVKGFVAAWNEALAWYKDGHEDEGNQIMADGLKMKLDDFKSMAAGVTWYDKDSMNKFFDKSVADNIYEVSDRAISFWVERGLIDEKYDSSKLISTDYLEK